MVLDLDKKDLINLVKGSSPNYEVMEHPLVEKSGRYTGGFVEKWDWREYRLKEMTEEELVELYNICKNSWV